MRLLNSSGVKTEVNGQQKVSRCNVEGNYVQPEADFYDGPCNMKSVSLLLELPVML